MPFKVQSSVQPITLPSVQLTAPTSAADFGGLEAGIIEQLGGGLERLGEQFGQVAEREERQRVKNQQEFRTRDDKAWVRGANSRFSDWARQNKVNFTSKKGVNSRGITKQATVDIDKAIQTVVDTAENDEQREFFKSSALSKRKLWLDQVSAHEASEFLQFEMKGIEAAQENATRDAAENYFDDVAVMSARLDLDKALDEQVQISGMSSDAAKNVKAGTVSLFHTGVLNRMVATNAVGAQEYYDQNKKEILPENREAIEKLINKEDVLQFSQTKSDEIVLREDDRAKWTEIARKEVDDPEKRKETVDLLKTRKTELDRHDDEARENAYFDTLDKITKAANLEDAKRLAKSLDNAEDSIKAEKVANNRFKISKEDNVTDRRVQAKIFDMIDKGQIKDVNQLIEFAPDLSSADYNRMITVLRNKNNPDAKVGFVKESTAKNAYETTKGEKYNIEDDSQEYMYIREQLDKQAQSLGRDLTPTEASKFAAQYMVEGISIGTGFIWDDKQTLVEAERSGNLGVWIPKINDDDIDNGQERRDIKDAFKKIGLDTDNDELFRLYKKEVTLDKPLSEEQTIRLNELIRIERNRQRNR